MELEGRSNTYTLSSGRKVYIPFDPDGPDLIAGTTGSFAPYTPEERREIALFVIQTWMQWADIIGLSLDLGEELPVLTEEQLDAARRAGLKVRPLGR